MISQTLKEVHMFSKATQWKKNVRSKSGIVYGGVEYINESKDKGGIEEISFYDNSGIMKYSAKYYDDHLIDVKISSENYKAITEKLMAGALELKFETDRLKALTKECVLIELIAGNGGIFYPRVCFSCIGELGRKSVPEILKLISSVVSIDHETILDMKKTASEWKVRVDWVENRRGGP